MASEQGGNLQEGQVSSVWAALANMQFGPHGAFVGPAWGQFPTCYMCLKVITDSRDVPVRDEDALISVIIRMAAFPGSRLASRPPRHARLCRPCYDHLKRVKEGLVSKSLLDRVRVLVSPWWSAPPPPSNGGPMARPHSPPLCPGFMDTDVDPNIRRRLIRSLNAECVDRVEKTIGEYVELNIELHRKLAAQAASALPGAAAPPTNSAAAAAATQPLSKGGGQQQGQGGQQQQLQGQADVDASVGLQQVLLQRTSPPSRAARQSSAGGGGAKGPAVYHPQGQQQQQQQRPRGNSNADDFGAAGGVQQQQQQPQQQRQQQSSGGGKKSQLPQSDADGQKKQPRVVVRGPVVNVGGESRANAPPRAIRGPLTFAPHPDGAFAQRKKEETSQGPPSRGGSTNEDLESSDVLEGGPPAASEEDLDDDDNLDASSSAGGKAKHSKIHPIAPGSELGPTQIQRHLPVPLVVPPRGGPKVFDDGLNSPRTGRAFDRPAGGHFRENATHRASRASYPPDDDLHIYDGRDSYSKDVDTERRQRGGDNHHPGGDEDTAAAVALLGHLAAAHQYPPPGVRGGGGGAPGPYPPGHRPRGGGGPPQPVHHQPPHYPPYPYGGPVAVPPPPPHMTFAPAPSRYDPQQHAMQQHYAAQFRGQPPSIPVFPVRDEEMPPAGVSKPQIVKN